MRRRAACGQQNVVFDAAVIDHHIDGFAELYGDFAGGD
jgi:hypothetical protein